jgi:hypothetical protein
MDPEHAGMLCVRFGTTVMAESNGDIYLQRQASRQVYLLHRQ